MSATSLTEMIRELLEFRPDSSLALVEFFERVWRTFKDRAKPIGKWLEKIPPDELLTVRQELDREAPGLILAIRIVESKLNTDGFPAVNGGLSGGERRGQAFSNVGSFGVEGRGRARNARLEHSH
jgi:hypothetical protein